MRALRLAPCWESYSSSCRTATSAENLRSAERAAMRVSAPARGRWAIHPVEHRGMTDVGADVDVLEHPDCGASEFRCRVKSHPRFRWRCSLGLHGGPRRCPRFCRRSCCCSLPERAARQCEGFARSDRAREAATSLQAAQTGPYVARQHCLPSGAGGARMGAKELVVGQAIARISDEASGPASSDTPSRTLQSSTCHHRSD
jgi:hypothetical protein